MINTINRIKTFMDDATRVEPMLLHEWCDYATVSARDAEHLFKVIDDKKYHLNDNQIHTKFEWEMIADMSGIHPDWCGYRKDKNGAYTY